MELNLINSIMSYVMVLIVILVIVGVGSSIIFPMLDQNKMVKRARIGIITDVIQVSAGGFAHPSKCILEVDGIKDNYEGGVCSFQIGDKICKEKELSIAWSLVRCEG